MMALPIEKRNDIYRYELMKPFEKRWAYYHVPLKAPQEHGYDVIMASGMLGHLAPAKVDGTQENNIKMLSSDLLWRECQKSVEKSLDCFSDNDIDVPVKEYLYSILLADPENPYIILCDGYSGEGGIPGYINAWLIPSEKTAAVWIPARLNVLDGTHIGSSFTCTSHFASYSPERNDTSTVPSESALAKASASSMCPILV